MGFAAGRAPKSKNVAFDFIRFLLPTYTKLCTLRSKM
jgi:hypothetical protein